MTQEIAVLIGTGSIGLAIARRAGIGRTVMLADYNETALNTAAQQLRDEGYDVNTQITDVSGHRAVTALADAAAALGPVTRLVHAARRLTCPGDDSKGSGSRPPRYSSRP